MNDKMIQIKELFDELYLHERELTTGQSDFVRSVKKQFARDKTLSDRQVKTLTEIRRFLPDQVRFSPVWTKDKMTETVI